MIGRILLSLIPSLAAPALAVAEAMDAFHLGEALFTGSRATSGGVRIGRSVLDVPLQKFACRGCHRRDGAGGQEGKAPPITWDALSMPTATRPAYDRAAFEAALKEGVAPDGRLLDATMPRYELSAGVIDGLSRYLADLPDLQRRGITRDSLTFGVVVPDDNRRPSERVLALLEKAMRRRTDGARIFGRTIEFRMLQGTRDTVLAEADRTIAAVVGLVPSIDIVAADFEHRGIPVLLPLAHLRGDEDPSLVRGLFPSLRQQATALAARAASDGRRTIGVAWLTVGRSSIPFEPDVDGSRLRQIDPRFVPPDVDAVLLLGDDEARAIELLRDVDSAVGLYAVAGQMPDLPAAARMRHVSLTLVDGYSSLRRRAAPEGAGLLAAYADVAAQILVQAIVAMGRNDATRASLSSAFDRARFPEIDVDYENFPLTGTDRMEFLAADP